MKRISVLLIMLVLANCAPSDSDSDSSGRQDEAQYQLFNVQLMEATERIYEWSSHTGQRDMLTFSSSENGQFLLVKKWCLTCGSGYGYNWSSTFKRIGPSQWQSDVDKDNLFYTITLSQDFAYLVFEESSKKKSNNQTFKKVSK